MPASGFIVVIASIAGSGLGALLLAFATSSSVRKSSAAGPLALLGVVGFFVLAGLVPWLALSRRWTWWIGSLVGAIVGLIGALVVAFTLSPPQLNICITTCGGPSTPSPTPAIVTILLFTIMLGVYGAGQALTVSSTPRKIGWFFTSAIAGVAFGVVLELAAQLIKVDPSTMPLAPTVAAGVAAGAVLGIGASLIR